MGKKKGPLPRRGFEVADVFQQYGAPYRLANRLPVDQIKVTQALAKCRTLALGGHLEACNACGFSRPSYNSCRNRHCPKCQSLAKARWLQAREKELLPVAYFHLVFTLPHELNPLAAYNKKLLYNLLFQAVAQTLLGFAQNPKKGLGGHLGITAILHTWDQRLGTHLHLHCAVPAGALAKDGKRWVRVPENFLFPVKALSKVFRGKFVHGLKQMVQKETLTLVGQQAPLKDPKTFSHFLASLYQKPWVVYAKPAFGGPQRVLDYLGRYTHRIAISNERILDIKDQSVTFTYKDRRQNHQKKSMTLEATEFIRRFLQHVLPHAFVRIRHFGLLANKTKKKHLAQCRELLGKTPPEPPKKQTTQELMRQLTGRDISRCPACKTGCLQITQVILPPWLHTRTGSLILMDSS